MFNNDNGLLTYRYSNIFFLRRITKKLFGLLATSPVDGAAVYCLKEIFDRFRNVEIVIAR